MGDIMSRFTVTLAKRQTEDSRFSHFEGTWEELVSLCDEAYDTLTDRLPGYRDGVVRLVVPPARFKTGIVQLEEDQALFGVFTSREPGEEPRKVLHARGAKKPAQYVEVIIYRDDVLRESPGYEPASEWEIISINASPETTPVPIPVGALLANHYGLSGGTATNLTAEEFEATLRQSVMYWKDKALCG
jgi:hypothetical protein